MPGRRPSLARALAALALAAGLVAPAVAAHALTGNVDTIVDLTFPVDQTARYGDDYTQPRSGGRQHCAVDLLVAKHTPVFAAVAGTITFMPTAKPSYGYMINVAGVDGRKYSYVHLNDDNYGTDDDAAVPGLAYAPGLAVGSRVARGQVIGYVGDSGNAKGTPHLHFEIHDPAVVNPACEIGGANRLNPFHAVDAARRRGDLGGGAPVAPAPTAPAPVTTLQARGIELACPTGRVPQSSFTDVGGTHQASVDCAAWWSIAAGRSATSFGPGDAINRAQLATFVVRLAGAVGHPLPAAPADLFDDDAGSVHEDAINRVAAAGIMGGADRRFAPNLAVTRGSMATVVAGTFRRVTGAALPAAANAFPDDDGTTHAANIDRVAAVGIAVGYADGRFQPGAPVSREQMTTFLARLLDALVERGAAPRR